MELDDLKKTWAAHGALLERSVAINERLLRDVMLRKVRARLVPYVAWRSLEVTLGVVVLFAVMSVLAAHGAEPRYLVVGGALAGFVAVATAMSAYVLVRAVQLDYGGPVTALQRAVEQLQAAEYRALKWAVLGGVLCWLPAALVLFEAVTGIAALARADLAWLVANLAFGVLIAALGQGLSRAYVERADLSPRARRLVDAVSGRALRRAAGHLAELASFEREPVA
ncbi:MAG: hypothetical protein ABIY55_23820 [Kofleriaceae bacterium]